jgi:RND family efflux transporter MFP subunit
MMKRFKTKPFVVTSIGVLILVAVAVAVFGPKSHAADDKKTGPKPALTVTTVQPTRARLPIKLAANGNIVAWQEAIIGSDSSGLRLSEVRVNVGDTVQQGQVLAVFAAEAVQADVAQSKAGLMEAEANASDAAANAARARTLQTTGALSAQQINQYLTAEQTAKAKAEAAKATLAAQQLRLNHTQLLAPDSGIISSRTATVGSVVSAGTEMFRMIRQGRLEWRAEVTSTELGHLKAGTSAIVTAANGTEIKGKVRMVAPTVDVQTRSALVYVDLPVQRGASAPAKAGMFARGEFELGTSDALTAPQQSIVVRDGFSYVFRLNTDSHVSQIKVQTGRRLGDRVEILGGVSEDAMLVVSGAGFLNDGDLVKNVRATAAASGAPAGASAPVTK